MQPVKEIQFNSILQDFVKLSDLVICPNCSKETKMVGETRINGNWICPFCLHYFPIKNNDRFKIEVPFIKLTNQLEFISKDNKQSQPEGILLGDPIPSFPMNLSTGFLVPSYSYKIKRKTNRLLAVMDDFSRKGRDKGGIIWQFDLVWNSRSREEYEALISFEETQGGHLPFTYTDPFRTSSHQCYFDSDVSEAEPDSFDNVSFSVRISE